MTYAQCSDLRADRGLGALWERNFCLLASRFGKSFTPHQIGRDGASAAAFARQSKHWNAYTLPDVTVWTAPGEHHEIKHKAPTKYNSFGLERYRFDALVWFRKETGQAVFYTIHNHFLAGGRDVAENCIEDWVTCEVGRLAGQFKEWPGTSYVGGKPTQVPICYWNVGLWRPLQEIWTPSF